MMGSFPSANPSLPTSIPGIYEDPSQPQGVVNIAHGGTGATTAAAALAALGGVAAGSHVLKTGLGGGNVSFTHTTTFAAMFASELAIGATLIPVGTLAIAVATWQQVGPASNNLTGGITVDGATPVGAALVGGSSSQDWTTTVFAVLAGDGATHTFDLFGFVSGGTATLLDAGANVPLLLLLMIAAT